MRFKHLAPLICLALAAAAAHTAMAAPPAPKAVAHAPAPATPLWTVDKAASRLTFRVNVSGQNVDGLFKGWDAQIAFDPKNLKSSHVAVRINIASVVTGDPTRDQMLPTPDWFSAEKFPKATFVTSAITQTAPGRYQAAGDLKIRGVSRHVVLPFTLAINKDVAQMDAALTIDRGWFGVGQGQFLSSDTVASNVTILVKLSAKKVR